MNRGLEISWEVGYCDNAAIRDEVQNGVAVRMALLFLTLTGGKQIENIDKTVVSSIQQNIEPLWIYWWKTV